MDFFWLIFVFRRSIRRHSLPERCRICRRNRKRSESANTAKIHQAETLPEL